MRNITEQFSVPVSKKVEMLVEATREAFLIISENKVLKEIFLTIGIYDAAGGLLRKDQYLISGKHWDVLMASSPPEFLSKPENEYRESDLWHIVDLIRQTTGRIIAET